MTPLIQTTPTQALIKRINRKNWWHVQPQDPYASEKRGKFYASSFGDAEFYGRPSQSERIKVSRPLVGDEEHIEMTLFGCRPSTDLDQLPSGMPVIQARLDLDARLKKAAVAEGYDSIVLITPKAWAYFCESGILPKSIELNVFL
jgi:hypothetical protein